MNYALQYEKCNMSDFYGLYEIGTLLLDISVRSAMRLSSEDKSDLVEKAASIY